MKSKILLLSLFSLFLAVGCNNNKTEESKVITRDSIKYYVYAKDDFKGAMVVGYEDSLPTEVTIPSDIDGYTVNAIRHESFVLSNITKITIPESVEYIGYRAFAECFNLKEISLPNSITKIYENTFAECDSLESIVIPDSVTEIQSGSFLGCDLLKSVTFSKNLKSLEKYVFYNCPYLNDVDLSTTQVEYIGSYCFENCTSLSNIKLSNVIIISRHCFSGCTSLSSIYLPDTLLFIGSSAFNKCSSLNEIFIPKDVTYIGKNVFNKINDNFKIMLEVETIPTTFSSNFNCYYPYVLGATRESKTTDVFVTNENINYGINSYQGSVYANLISPTSSFSATSIALPDSITYQESKTANLLSIGDYAFLGSTIKGITFNNSLKNLGSYSFANCTNLESIDLSSNKNIININNYAFYYDYNIRNIILPATATVTNIGKGTFYKCRKLESITNLDKITEELNLQGYTFAECYNLGKNKDAPFILTNNFKTITLTDFLEWGTTQDQYIQVASDAYTKVSEEVYLNANDGIIKLEKQSDETYKNKLFFSNATIILEPQV